MRTNVCTAAYARGGAVDLWRKLFAPWFSHADWCLAADARAWCHAACAVCCALLAGALLKLLPGFRRILRQPALLPRDGGSLV